MRFPSLRRKAITGTPAVLETIASRQNNLLPLLGGGSQRRILGVYTKAQSASYGWMYRSSPAVRTVIDLITRNVGQLDLRLYEEIDESQREARPDHPAALSLRYPSDSSTSDRFVRGLFKDFLIYDNSYALKFRNTANARTLFERLPAHMVEVIGSRLFAADGYRVHRSDGSFVDVTNPADMIHWHGEDPEDPRVGVSPLETLRNVVAEDAALQQAIVELANAGLVSPAWVSRPLEAPEWSNEARERFEEDLTNRLRRANRKPVVLEEGMELKDIGVSPRDAQMLDVRKWAIQQVASLYGVHPASVGLGQAGEVEEAQKILYSDVLPPICESFTRQLNLSVLVQEYGEPDYCFEFNLDEKHMGDDRLKSLVSATGRPVLTTNEGRAMVNRPPIKGGDELVTPANVIVGDKPKPSVDVMPIQDPNKPLQDGSHREEPKSKAVLPQLHPRFASDIGRQHRYVDEAQGLLERYYARQARSLRGKSAKLDSARWNRELADDLHNLVESIVEREGGIYVARLAGDDFDMRQVENYLRATAEGTAEALNRVTEQDIEDLGLEDALDRARGERAEVASANIGTRATVFARLEAAKQAPGYEHRTKTWIAHTNRHSALNGVTVAVDSSFGRIEPGSEPNCKCSLSIA